MSRKNIEILATAGLAAALVGAAYLGVARGGGSGSGASTAEKGTQPQDDYAEEGINPNPPQVVYPRSWMAGNCKVMGGGATEITSAEATAKGGRVFEKGFETLYSLPNGRCVSLAGPPPHPDWVPEWMENLPTPRPRTGPIIQIDPSKLPPFMSDLTR